MINTFPPLHFLKVFFLNIHGIQQRQTFDCMGATMLPHRVLSLEAPSHLLCPETLQWAVPLYLLFQEALAGREIHTSTPGPVRSLTQRFALDN